CPSHPADRDMSAHLPPVAKVPVYGRCWMPPYRLFLKVSAGEAHSLRSLPQVAAVIQPTVAEACSISVASPPVLRQAPWHCSEVPLIPLCKRCLSSSSQAP